LETGSSTAEDKQVKVEHENTTASNIKEEEEEEQKPFVKKEVKAEEDVKPKLSEVLAHGDVVDAEREDAPGPSCPSCFCFLWRASDPPSPLRDRASTSHEA
jgi:hypothetical protein